MHIFIDESGSFTGNPAAPSVSVVGALVIPDVRLARVEKQYGALRAGLPKDKGEVKGRLLQEADVQSVVSMLARNDVIPPSISGACVVAGAGFEPATFGL